MNHFKKNHLLENHSIVILILRQFMLKPVRGFRNHRCPGCQLPKHLCICSLLPYLNTKATFWVLMHPFEYGKPTNTGRIIQDCIPQTKIIFWERTTPDFDLLSMIQDQQDVFLMFPEEYKTDHNSIAQSIQLSVANPHFILLDGTWKQARKIFRKSPYLHRLPMISIKSNQKSIYMLRRPSQNHHLCTIEVAITLLDLNGEIEQSRQMNSYFKKFINRHMNHRTGEQVFN